LSVDILDGYAKKISKQKPLEKICHVKHLNRLILNDLDVRHHKRLPRSNKYEGTKENFNRWLPSLELAVTKLSSGKRLLFVADLKSERVFKLKNIID
jgi:hypothetical protein